MSNANFSIGGGKSEVEGINWKYLDSAETLDEALFKFFEIAIHYPVREFCYTNSKGEKFDLAPVRI